MKKEPPIEFSLIIPVFNGGVVLDGTLAKVTKWFSSQDAVGEVLIVDDGSTDDSQRTIARFVEERIRLVSLPANRGKWNALKEGCRQSHGEYVVFTDADLPYGVEGIERILATLKESRAPVVVGDRLIATSSVVKNTDSRRMISLISRYIVAPLLLGHVLDSQCGLKGMRSMVAHEVVPTMRVGGFCGDLEFLQLAKDRGLAVCRCPVSEQMSVHSSVRISRVFIEAMWVVPMLLWRRLKSAKKVTS